MQKKNGLIELIVFNYGGFGGCIMHKNYKLVCLYRLYKC